jgi:RimJ/RimL family protein N-acetyltransferase
MAGAAAMNEVLTILQRNQGQVLTPELIHGIYAAIEYDKVNSLVATTPLPPVPEHLVEPRPSNRRLVIDETDRVAQWVATMIGHPDVPWAGHIALGLEKEGVLVAGVVLENYNGANANAHLAGVGKHWMNRTMLLTFFRYAFGHLGLKRLTALVDADNTTAIQLNTHFGFTIEHTIRDGSANGDVVMMGLRREDCRYLGD